ncbi:ATP-dependent Clp protease proteolytic subunit, mitochondrial-like [Mizuhopecten yessoensis]|uniref:ATP-dependent Clp protease proteolytic subunit n=1 Tax=Mizuhopecten yessoensis TaxID=6573 RepID=A0A210PHS8_MIZYE|nr:ATP-dependent Clp protease proteolytic subunit, mitochondrial-like [Mizuhopecten yessoensis]OWF36040.1 ATP-dependent Clp protease proteolytic subunit, mitochondrial [Mizuhopecten yessoensis]
MALLQRCLRFVPRNIQTRMIHHTRSRKTYSHARADETPPETNIYAHLLQQRIICIMTPICDVVAGSIIAQILYLQAANTKQTIHMYINCAGGRVSSTLGIYDTMQFVSNPIATWCVGQATDMGSLLLAAGAPGMRNALPHSRITLMQPVSGLSGQASDVAIQAEEISRILDQVNNIYAKHTGRSLEQIEEVMQRHRFMDAETAKDFGIIDKVLEFPEKNISQ